MKKLNTFFYIDGDELLCEIGSETCKLADVEGRLVSFLPLAFIREDHPETEVTQEVIQSAIDFVVRDGYIADSYAPDA